MSRLDLDDVALFAAVVEASGFRTAAEKHGMSASSLSDCVRRLEARLGVRLLNRTTRCVTPTEAGSRLIQRLRPALEEISDALNDLNDDQQSPVGTLKLNVPVPVAQFVMPTLLAGFLERYPGVRVEVMMDNSFIDVIAAGFDAGVRYEERLAKDMIATPIGPRRQRFVAAASPAYLARYGTPQHPQELTSHRLLGNRFASGVLGIWEFEKDGQSIRITPEGPLLSSSTDLRISAASAGVGIIYTFEEYLRPLLDNGTLQPILEGWWQNFSGPYLYYHQRRQMPAPLRAFIDYLKQTSAQ
ncbi:LysR family transcriptional regulator [Pseudomonas borbori]